MQTLPKQQSWHTRRGRFEQQARPFAKGERQSTTDQERNHSRSEASASPGAAASRQQELTKNHPTINFHRYEPGDYEKPPRNIKAGDVTVGALNTKHGLLQKKRPASKNGTDSRSSFWGAGSYVGRS
jgi:hypothetical protein